MGLFDRQTTLDAAEDLLDRERLAIRAGRFDILERLVPEKQRLVAAIDREHPSAESLARLRSAAERNGKLLEAMKSGVQAAMRRLETARSAGPDLSTYDQEGRRNVFRAPGRGGKAHRA